MTDYGQVIWITGLSGTGKSTLCRKLNFSIIRRSMPLIMFDGNELSDIFGAEVLNQQNHSLKSRVALAMNYLKKLCQAISKEGINVIIATISLFKEAHLWNRVNIPSYFEIYLKVPVEELLCRDSKKICP